MIDISYIHLIWILAALTYCAVGLIAIWAALGQPHWFWRITVVGAMLGLMFPIEAHELLLIYFAQATVVILPLTLIRYIRRRGAGNVEPPAGDAFIANTRPRFSLRDLLLMTLVAAFIFSAAVNVREDIWQYAWIPIACGACFGLVTLATVWLGLGRRWIWMRILLALVLVPPLAALFPFDRLTATALLDDFLPIHAWILSLFVATLTATWLWIAREAGFLAVRGGAKGMSSSSAGGVTFGTKQRRGFRVVAVCFSLLIFVPPATIYYRMATPTPIPDIVLPERNGYDDLVNLGNRLRNVAIPGVNGVATEATLRTFVNKHGELFDEARLAIEQDCQVPVEFSTDDSDFRQYVDIHFKQMSAFRMLARAFRAEGKLAAIEDRTGDAVRSYLNAIQLGQAAARGGLTIDFLMGMGIEGIGLKEVFDIRDELSSAQRLDSIDALLTFDRNREPYGDVFLREKASLEHVYGWLGRLYVVLRMLTGEEPSPLFVRAPRNVTAKSRLLICELAILNYQTDHKHAPKVLAELVPDYLPAVPTDPFSGKPIVYRRATVGFVLYSIGPDEQDNGGKGFDGGPYNTPGDIILEDIYSNTDDTTTPNATTE